MNDEHDVIHFVDCMITAAVESNASDIHIERYAQGCRIRFRENQSLRTYDQTSSHFTNKLNNRLKLLANLNIAEERRPQDGHFLFKNTHLNIRISTCPTIYGEKIALRLLNQHNKLLDLNQLGLSSKQLSLLHHKLHQRHGLILTTGATGSGKTTTLYAALHYLNQLNRHIITLEDPVEIELEGINQINVQHQIGLTFAAMLRTILRQDPDIIMVGEIRDSETALIALQAAQTGHLVLSTLHTYSAECALSRFAMMDIPTNYIHNAISLIVSQHMLANAPHASFQLHTPATRHTT